METNTCIAYVSPYISHLSTTLYPSQTETAYTPVWCTLKWIQDGGWEMQIVLYITGVILKELLYLMRIRAEKTHRHVCHWEMVLGAAISRTQYRHTTRNDCYCEILGFVIETLWRRVDCCLYPIRVKEFFERTIMIWPVHYKYSFQTMYTLIGYKNNHVANNKKTYFLCILCEYIIPFDTSSALHNRSTSSFEGIMSFTVESLKVEKDEY